jgi:hypothetical protein
MVIWYIFPPVLVYCVKKKLASLLLARHLRQILRLDTHPEAEVSAVRR